MSKTETTRFISLIKEVTVGKTLLTVEHDMGVVFGLAITFLAGFIPAQRAADVDPVSIFRK